MPQDAFVLGAGFSIAVADQMPTTDGLGETVLTRQRGIHRSQSEVHSSNCDGISCGGRMLVNGKWPAPNFEVWLSRLAEDQPYLYEPDNYERRALYERLTALVALEIETTAGWAMRSDPPAWFLELVQRWMSDGASVVTLNYDTFVESMVEHLACGRHTEPSAKMYSVPIRPRLIPLNPALVDPVGNEPMRISDGFDPAKISLYKLHGSTRWFWDDQTRSSDSMVDIGQGSGWYRNRSAEADRREVPGKVQVIVPPTTTKSRFFANGIVREIWRGAYEALRCADRVFVLGYSLPPADLVVQSLLTEAFTVKRPEVFVVNIEPTIARNFEHLGVRLNTEFCFREDPIPRFVERYISWSQS
jgi:hypothetical protein